MEFTHETTKAKQKSNSVKLLSSQRHCTLQLKSKPDKRQQTRALNNITEIERYGEKETDRQTQLEQ